MERRGRGVVSLSYLGSAPVGIRQPNATSEGFRAVRRKAVPGSAPRLPTWCHRIVPANRRPWTVGPTTPPLKIVAYCCCTSNEIAHEPHCLEFLPSQPTRRSGMIHVQGDRSPLSPLRPPARARWRCRSSQAAIRDTRSIGLGDWTNNGESKLPLTSHADVIGPRWFLWLDCSFSLDGPATSRGRLPTDRLPPGCRVVARLHSARPNADLAIPIPASSHRHDRPASEKWIQS